MRILLKIVCLLPLALPLTFVLIRWPLVFAVVGGSGCVLALIAMAVQIVRSDRLSARLPPPVCDAAATVDGVPVRVVEVLR